MDLTEDNTFDEQLYQLPLISLSPFNLLIAEDSDGGSYGVPYVL